MISRTQRRDFSSSFSYTEFLGPETPMIMEASRTLNFSGGVGGGSVFCVGRLRPHDAEAE